MFELFLSCLVVMSASLVGVVAFSHTLGSYIERRLEFLVSFSAGVFLVFAYHVAGEAIEHSVSTLIGLGSIVGGAVVVAVLFRLFPQAHKHEHGHHGHQHLDARRLLLVDGVHNAADGVFLAASYALSVPLGLAATAGVFAHELLQEISEFFVLKDAGYSTKRALVINFAISSTILVGAVGGYFLLDQFEMLEGPLLSLVVGGILVVVLSDLLPHAAREATTLRHYLSHAGFFLLGVALMFGVTLMIPHAEPQADPAPTPDTLAR